VPAVGEAKECDHNKCQQYTILGQCVCMDLECRVVRRCGKATSACMMQIAEWDFR
jgi:hypothetical protein